MWSMSNLLIKEKYFVNIGLGCHWNAIQAALKKILNAFLVLLLLNLEQHD